MFKLLSSSYNDLRNNYYITIRCYIFNKLIFTCKRKRISKPRDWQSQNNWTCIKELLYLN
jgi:hypothetical protein